MHFLKITALFLLLLLPCRGQLPSTNTPAPLTGVFYISVDDAATIFVNGQEKYKAGIGESHSPEMELKAGDRIVVELRNDGDGRHFMLVFCSSDQKTIVSFKHLDFRCIIGDAKDFTPDQFHNWKTAKEEKGKKPGFPIKNYSEKVWGDLDRSSIAAIVTPGMISQKPQ